MQNAVVLTKKNVNELAGLTARLVAYVEKIGVAVEAAGPEAKPKAKRRRRKTVVVTAGPEAGED